MSARELAEWATLLIAAATTTWALRRASRETTGLSDDTARKLRADLTLADQLTRMLRRQRDRLEDWIVEHMLGIHHERFDPTTIYKDEEGDD